MSSNFRSFIFTSYKLKRGNYFVFMVYKTFLPPPDLAPYIRFYWFMESDACQNEPFVYRAMAESCPGLIYHYKATFKDITTSTAHSFPHSIFHGQSSKTYRFCTHQNFGIFGVYLYPFAIPWLCNMPATALSNQMPHLVDVLGNQGKILEEKIIQASGIEDRINIMNAFFAQKLRQSPSKLNPISKSINYLIKNNGNVPIKELAEKFAFSTRQFERKFKDFAGFNPKLFARIIRFQSTTNHYGNQDLSLTSLSHQCGYYDQSHFIHEFKLFSGYHPKTFFKGRTEGIEFREV